MSTAVERSVTVGGQRGNEVALPRPRCSAAQSVASTREDDRATTCAECTCREEVLQARGAARYRTRVARTRQKPAPGVDGRRCCGSLVSEDPTALLIGFCLDQQVPIEWAFQGPLRMRERLGTIDPSEVARMDPDHCRDRVQDPTRPASVPGEHGAARVRTLSGDLDGVRRRYHPHLDRSGRTRRISKTLRRPPRFRRGEGPDHGRRRRQAPGGRPAGWENVAPDWPTLADVQHARGARGLPDPEAGLQGRDARRGGGQAGSREIIVQAGREEGRTQIRCQEGIVHSHCKENLGRATAREDDGACPRLRSPSSRTVIFAS